MFGNEVADVALGYVIGLARSLFQIDRATREGEWIKPTGISLAGKRVALVGYGDIGQQTCNRLIACGMNVTIYDPTLTPGQQLGENRCVGEWPVGVHAHDFVVLTCALTPHNRQMLNADVLSKCDGIRVVNVARGPLIDEVALVEALDNGSVNSVALDVFEKEPLPMGAPLRRHPNTVFGSHNGSNTIDAVIKTNVRAINLIDELLAGAVEPYMSEFGKAVLVTGVLGGVGSALREQFEKSGYYVIGTDILSDSRGDRSSFFQVDLSKFVTEPQLRREFRAQVVDWLNHRGVRLQGIVNNAAVQILGGVEDLSLQDFEDTLRVNLSAPLMLTQLFFCQN